jgi:glycosyltransferase involved in cell wall biosynthesis
MPPHHILHLLDTSEYEWTGIAKIVVALAERLDPQKFRIHAWFRHGHGPLVEMLEKKGVAVRVLDWPGGERSPVGLLRFALAIRGQKFSLVHQHFGGRAVRWISRYVGGARVIVHLHSRALEQKSVNPARCNVDGADLVVATSEATAKWSGVDAEVVYPGLEIRVPVLDASARHNPNGHVLGTAGRLAPIKGIKYLIRALPMIQASVSDVTLEIAGSGPEELALRDEAYRLGVDGCVRFLGWQEEIPFHRWNIFVMPSLEESFGIVVLEAMTAGLPVVASTVGGLPELVEDGKTGWLVPPSNPEALCTRLVSLLLNPHEQQVMGDAAHIRATKFSAKHMCEEIERLYNRLLI